MHGRHLTCPSSMKALPSKEGPFTILKASDDGADIAKGTLLLGLHYRLRLAALRKTYFIEFGAFRVRSMAVSRNRISNNYCLLVFH